MPSSLPERLGIFGFALALLALVLQYLQYRWSKRSFREQREEKVKARVVYNPAFGPRQPHWILQVYVVNVGMVPVYIKCVGLGYSTAHRAQEVMVPQEDGKEGPVAPGDERYYRLQADEYEDLEDIAQLPRESVQLTVRTPEKEILRVTGKDMFFIGVAELSEEDAGGCSAAH